MAKLVDGLRARLEKTTRKSGFSIWLGRGTNYNDFAASIAEFGVRWSEVAAWAKAADIAGDRSFTPAAAKRAWEREKCRRKVAAEKAATTVTARNPEPARGVRIFPVPALEPEPVVRLLPDPTLMRQSSDVDNIMAALRERMAAADPYNPPKVRPPDVASDDTLDAGRGWLPKPPRR
jgi:hypothetical protein